MYRPLPCIGIMIVKAILLRSGVGIIDSYTNGLEAVIPLQIDIVLPPGQGRMGIISIDKVYDIRAVGYIVWSLVGLALVIWRPVHLVDIAVRQVVLVNKSPIGVLKPKVQTPEVAVILVARVSLDGIVDHSIMEIIGPAGRHANHIIEPETRTYVQEHPTGAHIPGSTGML
ncbi:hypothetical protein ES703_53971 [subsurface metagenome]